MENGTRTPALRILRRLLQGIALIGTLLVAVVAAGLIVSQTPWFRDWLRRYIVRESRQYLNGELSIGGLNGNLFFGVQLSDVAVDISGTRVVAVKGLEVDYSVFHLVSRGVVLDGITLVEPRLRLERNGEGWNIDQLVKAQRREADRKGPARPITLRSIRIADGAVSVDDRGPASAFNLPARIQDLDVRAAFAYEPVRYTIDVEHLSFRAESPDLALRQLAGRVAVRDDDLHLERVVLQAGETALTIDGAIQDYLHTPVLRVTAQGHVSLPEIGRIYPAASEYDLRPAFNVKASGPAERLALDFDVHSEAGRLDGRVTADVRAPDLAVKGDVRVDRLDLAPLLRTPSQRSDVSGRAKMDLRLASQPARTPAFDRLSGTFTFAGPHVAAMGYEASNVTADGAFEAGRVRLKAKADAYGGSATAAGYIRPAVATPPRRVRVVGAQAGGRPLAFELGGQAERIDLRNLPASLRVPPLETNLSAAQYEVRGEGRTVSGRVVLNRSMVEGATVEEGTVAEFTARPSEVSYSARGRLAELNLRRMGQALNITALDKSLYDSRIAGTFDVVASGTTLERLTLDATGTLTDATIAGARLNDLAFETHIKDGSLDTTAKGAFANLNPAVLTNRADLEGQLAGSVDVRLGIASLGQPITTDSVSASGEVHLLQSTLGKITIDRVAVQSTYARQIADITQLEVASPDLTLTASGRLALDRSSESSLAYRVEAKDLAVLAALAGQEGIEGSVVLDGRVTGNAALLTTTGTLDGSNLTYRSFNALDVDSTYSVAVPELSTADAGVEAKTNATFVKGPGVRLNQFTATTAYKGRQLHFSTSLKEETRELDARGQVVFHPDHQEIHLPELAIRTQGLEWKTVEGVDTAIQYGRGLVTLQNVRLISGDQSVAVGGSLALEDEGDPAALLDVKAENVDLAQLERLLLQNRGFSGRLSANASISGSTRLPIVDGHVEVHDGGFRNYRYQSLVADVDYGSNRIDLDATLQQSPTETFSARGTIPMTLFEKGEEGHVAETAADRIDVRIQTSDLGLGFVQGFTTAVTNITGTLQGDIHVTGSGRDPHLEGHIDIRNGAFGVPLGGVSYKGLDTRIELTPDAVSIRSFDIVDEEGHRMSVSGRLAVHEREVGEVDVNIASTNFEVIDNELGDVGLDSKIKITGELRRPRIEGEVRTEAARIEVDQVLQLFYDPYSVEALPSVVSAERSVEGSGSAQEATRQALLRAQTTGARAAEAPAAAPPEEAAAGGVFAPVTMDVHVIIPDNLVLRGNDLRPGGPTGAAIGDLNITVGGDLQVQKAAGGPVTLIGTVTTVRGTYEFQGRRFELERGGTLRFAGDAELNPLVDVAATRLIPETGVEARIRITGSVKAPQLQLSSTPPLEESDILALIIFNRPVNELGTGERASLAATAGGIATGFLAAPLGESIGRALDLDQFEITTTSESGELGAGLIVGQQIGDRAFFKLQQQFGRQNVSEFLLEFQLADFLRMRATASPETTGSANRLNQRRVERAGIDLIFFFSY